MQYLFIEQERALRRQKGRTVFEGVETMSRKMKNFSAKIILDFAAFLMISAFDVVAYAWVNSSQRKNGMK